MEDVISTRGGDEADPQLDVRPVAAQCFGAISSGNHLGLDGCHGDFSWG